ncbi:MAG: hypothetical protein HY873_08975 [Chloroflexi bacterium]|nr:hypothetical protein [Chloroflexota bacterium]
MDYVAFAILALLLVGSFAGMSIYVITGRPRKGELQGGMPWFERFALEDDEAERGWAEVWLLTGKREAQKGCLHFTDRRVIYTPNRGRMSWPFGILRAPFVLTYDEIGSSKTKVMQPFIPMALPTGARALVLCTTTGSEHVFLPNGRGLLEVATRLLPKHLQPGVDD